MLGYTESLNLGRISDHAVSTIIHNLGIVNNGIVLHFLDIPVDLREGMWAKGYCSSFPKSKT